MKISKLPGWPQPARQFGVISLRFLLVLLCLLALGAGLRRWPGSIWPVGAAAQDGPRSPDGLWQEITETPAMQRQTRQIKPQSYRTLRLNQVAMQRLLRQAPLESSAAAQQTQVVITIPLPDGSFASFRIEESPIMAPELAAQFPEIKTFRGQGLDDPTATASLDWTPQGFHAQILSAGVTVYVDPYAQGDTANYIAYSKSDYPKRDPNWQCLVPSSGRRTQSGAGQQPHVPNGSFRRELRLAMAATGEYTTFFRQAGDTDAQAKVRALAAINTTMNRVNGIWERDMAIRFVLIANELAIIYTNAATDPYTNEDPNTAADENQANLDAVIGDANYDQGHVFLTAGGGVGGEGVCITGAKAGGATGTDNPVGDPFDVDFVAHEIIHQFGAGHTFNALGEGACTAGNREPMVAYEPGSASTVASYAGTCDASNLQLNSDDYFHSASLDQVINYVTNIGTCANQVNIGNQIPTVNAGANFTVPRGTPFTLTATGNDPNGDALTYCWEEFDLGAASPPNTDNGNRPIFRSYRPSVSPARTFPSLQYILNNANIPPATVPCGQENCLSGETVTNSARTMNFRVTVRDNHAGGGGINTAMMQVTVVPANGPFRLTAPNTAVNWTGGTQQTVTWDVSGTNAAPINAANVKLSLSTDGGQTFSTVLAASTPNDGSQAITVPNGINTTMARLKVEAVGNIFFDISDTNFTITGVVCPTITINPANATLTTGTVGTPYVNANLPFTQTGGTGTVAWDVPAGALPDGLTLNPATGALTGTPSAAGNFTFTVRATVGGCPGTRQYTLAINPAAGATGLQFYPLPSPIRLLETRAGFTGCTMPGVPINANGTLTLPARTTCAGIPAAAAAVTGNITVVPSGPGFLTLFPSSATQPTVANSNFQTNEITNNVFTVGLGAGDGAFKIFSSATTHVIVDVTGYYAPPNTGGLYFHPLATPVRLLETRLGFTGCITPGTPLVGTGNANADPNLDLLLQGRSPVAAPCNSIPTTAQVLVGNATSVLPTGLGYLTIYPSGGTRPTVASSNYAGADVINGPFAVKLGTDGKFKIYTFATTNLVVDILGYYSADVNDANGAGLLFNPLPSPVRLLETRPGFAGCTMTGAPIVGNLANATHTQMAANFCGLPAAAQAVVGNVSVVNTTGAGFLTLFPANLTTAPLVATSNYPAPATFGYNRHFFVGLSPADGQFKVLTQFTTHLILDASGYFAP